MAVIKSPESLLGSEPGAWREAAGALGAWTRRVTVLGPSLLIAQVGIGAGYVTLGREESQVTSCPHMTEYHADYFKIETVVRSTPRACYLLL